MRRLAFVLLVLAGCTPPPPSAAPAPVAPVAPAAPAVQAPQVRDRVELALIAPAGLERTRLDVDPFTATAHLAFQAESGATVYLAVSVQESVAAAQSAVLLEPSRITGASVPATGVGLVCDSGFAATDATGNVAWAALERANVNAVLRGSDDTALRSVAAAWLAAVDASDLVPALRTPRLSLSFSASARAGSPNPLAVTPDPSGPAPASFAYRADNGASLVGSRLGPVLYAARSGTVHVKVAAATSRLVSSVVESDLALGK